MIKYSVVALWLSSTWPLVSFSLASTSEDLFGAALLLFWGEVAVCGLDCFFDDIAFILFILFNSRIFKIIYTLKFINFIKTVN